MGNARGDRQGITGILERNRRVEADKAWETSFVRRMIIALMTYVVVVAFLFVIHAPSPWLSALVPAIGFVLSTLTLSAFKGWWLNTAYKK